MDKSIKIDYPQLIGQALSGNKDALEALLISVQDLVFNLSLRMLGTIPDAEDAAQEILVKVMTSLSAFRQESAFTTWVFRIAVNHLKNYKKSMFAAHPLSFEYYGEDILSGRERDVPDLSRGVDRALLERELKLSCMNVMLQCFDADSRCIFILGTMFKVDSRVAGDILGISPEAYRQRLSRAKKKMAQFLSGYCGAGGSGPCACARRVDYAIATHRLDPGQLAWSGLSEDEKPLEEYVDAMEQIDDASLAFSTFPAYRATETARKFLADFLQSDCYALIAKA